MILYMTTGYCWWSCGLLCSKSANLMRTWIAGFIQEMYIGHISPSDWRQQSCFINKVRRKSIDIFVTKMIHSRHSFIYTSILYLQKFTVLGSVDICYLKVRIMYLCYKVCLSCSNIICDAPNNGVCLSHQ